MLYLDSLKFEPVANIIDKYINGRELVLLGDSKNLRKLLLEQYLLEPKYIATSVESNLEKGPEYRMLSDFVSSADQYYICIPFLQYDEKLKERLESYGYEEFKDFVFALYKRITIPPMTENYVDEYGNKIVSSGNFKVILTTESGNCVVNVSENVRVGGNSNIIMAGNRAEICIEKGCLFASNTHFEVYLYSKIRIRERATFGHDFTVRATANSLIDIGKDCMFSDMVEVYGGDGHSIFDIKSQTRRNEVYPHNEKNEIIIGEHVWIGLRTTILSSKIGRHSIMGAGAIVKGKFPANCIAVGNPAVVKKTGITWGRSNIASGIEECGDEFGNL